MLWNTQIHLIRFCSYTKTQLVINVTSNQGNTEHTSNTEKMNTVEQLTNERT